MAEISAAVYFVPATSTTASPPAPSTMAKGLTPMDFLTSGSVNFRPISRLMANSVLVGLVTAWRLAIWPTRRSLLSEKATMDGVVRLPSLFSITLGSPPSMIATHELVVPRSIPMIFPMMFLSCLFLYVHQANLPE